MHFLNHLGQLSIFINCKVKLIRIINWFTAPPKKEIDLGHVTYVVSYQVWRVIYLRTLNCISPSIWFRSSFSQDQVRQLHHETPRKRCLIITPFLAGNTNVFLGSWNPPPWTLTINWRATLICQGTQKHRSPNLQMGFGDCSQSTNAGDVPEEAASARVFEFFSAIFLRWNATWTWHIKH